MNHKGLKDRIIEFIGIVAALFTIIVLLGVELKAYVIIFTLTIGLGYISVLHIKNFFQSMNDNIEEIKNYIKEYSYNINEVTKMNKKGKVSWLVIIWSVIIGLALFLLFKTLFNL